MIFFSGTKHIQELVEVRILDDFSQKYDDKIIEITNEISEALFSRLLNDCSVSCNLLFSSK